MKFTLFALLALAASAAAFPAEKKGEKLENIFLEKSFTKKIIVFFLFLAETAMTKEAMDM